MWIVVVLTSEGLAHGANDERTRFQLLPFAFPASQATTTLSISAVLMIVTVFCWILYFFAYCVEVIFEHISCDDKLL